MKGYYELEQLRQGILEELEPYEEDIKKYQEKAKKYKKGSKEREIANDLVKSFKTNVSYLHLKDKLKTVNYCINVCFY